MGNSFAKSINFVRNRKETKRDLYLIEYFDAKIFKNLRNGDYNLVL